MTDSIVKPDLETITKVNAIYGDTVGRHTLSAGVYLTANPSAFGGEPSARIGLIEGPPERHLTRLCLPYAWNSDGPVTGWIEYPSHAEAVDAVQRLAIKLDDAHLAWLHSPDYDADEEFNPQDTLVNFYATEGWGENVPDAPPAT